MKKYFLVCVVIILVGFTTSSAEPLRKCSSYEIMNDDDGLVQNPKDEPSVCAYAQQDLAAAKGKIPKGRSW